MSDQFTKTKLTLRYLIAGMAAANPRFNLALQAMALAEQHHTGLRKDGSTPEIQHQYEICLYLLTILGNSPKAPEIIAAALLHDLYEDYGVPIETIAVATSGEIAVAVVRLSKVRFGPDGDITKVPMDKYFEEISKCLISSLVKGADRVNNLQSMLGVFSDEKQREYVNEAQTWFLPMLKQARKNFPDHLMAYHNIRLMMKSQVELIKARLDQALSA